MARRVLMVEVSGGWVFGSQRLDWMDSMKVTLGSRRIMVEDARQCAKDWKEWRALVHMRVLRSHYCLVHVFFRNTLSCSGGYHLERGG